MKRNDLNKYKLTYLDNHENPMEKLIDADHFFFDEGFCLFFKKNEENGGQPVLAMSSEYVYSVELTTDLDDLINTPIK